jgi:hypothetical protein
MYRICYPYIISFVVLDGPLALSWWCAMVG